MRRIACKDGDTLVLDVIIVGAGLSGLALGEQLQQDGRSFQILEARRRVGGRIFSEHAQNGRRTAAFDMGPTWFWPGQERMRQLVSRLGLSTHLQYSKGALVYEDASGRIQRHNGFSTMEGSIRVEGSMSAIVDGLASAIPQRRRTLGACVTSVSYENDFFTVTYSVDGQTKTAESKQLALAIPPRLAEDRIDFSGILNEPSRKVLRSVPTWMAGHAKFVAVFDSPFWKHAGLSGDGISRRGPLVETHDASPKDHQLHALFGFIGVDVGARSNSSTLKHACIKQLTRMFGEQAKTPLDAFIKDWALESDTSVPSDFSAPSSHPTYGYPKGFSNLCDGKLVFASTEVANHFGGYMEGALEAAEHAFSMLR